MSATAPGRSEVERINNVSNDCRRCGYNLKGLMESRCSECGTGFLYADKES